MRDLAALHKLERPFIDKTVPEYQLIFSLKSFVFLKN
jgi:hypothetical protein